MVTLLLALYLLLMRRTMDETVALLRIYSAPLSGYLNEYLRLNFKPIISSSVAYEE
jgi:hypothetical protein